MSKRLVLIALLSASASLAQVNVQIQIPLPTITFQAPPPLVVVQPGVQVVENNEQEVFFVDGYYWHRRDEHWFRTRTHNGRWEVVDRRYVPRTIVALPPGQYRNWKRERHEEKVERREERHDERRDERHERREEHHDDDEGGRGDGHGHDRHDWH